MRRFAVLAGAVGVLLSIGVSPVQAAAPGWLPPACGKADSDGSLTHTWNAGHHIAATTGVIQPRTQVSDLKTLATPNELLAVDYSGRLQAGHEAGCSWVPFGAVEGLGPYAISPAPDGSAYVWTKANDDRLYRVWGTKVAQLPPVPAVETGGLTALVADPRDSEHLRGVTVLGVVLDSRDGGRTFQRQGTTPRPIRSGQIAAYDGAVATGDIDHIVLGTLVDGVFTTSDGGQTWTHAALGPADHRVNVFTVAVSPADDSVVWAMGLDITEYDSGSPSEGRHIFRSTDGGRTFTAVVDHGASGVTLTNGLLLVPDPVDAALVYFEFGTWYAGYGTDLFAYDARLGRLRATHNGYDDITAIAFNPAFPMVMYLGLAEIR